MTFGNEVVSGNMGLQDQILALQWIKHNIQYFGGDPKQITLVGESAGAISSHAIQLSPQAHGLISGVILQSGTMLITKKDPETSNEKSLAISLAKNLNCPSINTDTAMLNCLQSVKAENILKAQPPRNGYELQWMPVVDYYATNPVLPLDPLHALNLGHFNQVPTLTGTILKEGTIYAMEKDQIAPLWAKRAPALIGVSSEPFSPTEQALADIMLKYYMAGNIDPFSNLDGFVNAVTDSFFLSPDQKISELQSLHVPVYNYRFSYKGPRSLLSVYLPTMNISQPNIPRLMEQPPSHSDGLLYLFNILGPRNEEEEAMSAVMTKYWTNFAKYGVPNHPMEDKLPIWHTYYPNKGYLDLNLTPTMKTEVEFERMLL